MNERKRRAIFSKLQETMPEPTTELVYATPFELLVSVLLSAQATDVSVNKATKVLFADASTPKSIHKLGVKKLETYIKSIGLFHTKARNLLKTCKILMDKHNSVVPETREELEALPGVGRKTANVILNTAFGQPTIAVDTHIFRLANRLNLAPGSNVRKVEDKLMRLVPKEYLLDAHHWLILHGRYVCLARKPRCGSCTIADLCEYKEKTEIE